MNSSNASSDVDYEVFLSFRGADTRQGFTDVLYGFMSTAEIRVFRDDNELAIGDKIESILGAIDRSKICIPIFSLRFAESKWCLLEVTRMVELKKTIVPVFYNVTSDDVKLKTSLYSNDLQKLEEKYGEEEVQKWKEALKEVVSNKGRTLGVKGYTEFCKELVDEVLSKLGPRKILDIDYFVGDANKARAMELLDVMGSSSSHQVIYAGIHGMGGIGKTTLTKLIHNECMSSFDHCAFLPDIREFSKRNGVQDLPKYLYDNVEPKSVAAFSQSRQIPNTFKNKKVVLILDDVDSCEQITAIAKEPGWFGSGSRVIVTTRDKDVLRDYEKESETEMRYLEMEELDSGWSLELFSKCAFRKDSPPLSYQDLSKRVVAYAGGLPLTIMVIGKLLRRYRTEGEWEEFIERLDKNPPKEVKDRLMISYEELEENEKKIFLDVACLFIGKMFTETSEVFYMWKACDLYPRLSLEVLQARSLVKIDEDNELQMHDQLRDFGRDIVRAKCGGDVTKQSRLWESSEVMEVLKYKKKTKGNIEAITIEDIPFDMNVEEFISFDNLRYLAADHTDFMFGWVKEKKFQGNFSNLLPKLIWLTCHMFTIEPRTLVPSNLVILNLIACDDVDENSAIFSQIQVLKKLKVLNLSCCRKLERTPVFAEDMVLERLDLSECSELKFIDPSIAKLQHLNYLSLANCDKLERLESLVLKKLKVLYLSCCERLEKTPVFGKNMVLERLDLSGCLKLKYIDPSIGKLQHLNCLSFFNCSSLDELPESLGELHAIRELELGGTSITHLPDSIGKLEKLETLNLYSCKSLVNLPQSIGNLRSLVRLDIQGTKINRLPASIGRLEKLQQLDLCDSKVSQLPSEISHLSLLQSLTLSRCHQLQELPELPASLTNLIVGSDVLNKVADLSNLQHLTYLRIVSHGAAMLDWNGSFARNCKLQTLSVEVPYISRLPDLTCCSELTHLEFKCQYSFKVLPNISGLRKLVSLKIESCHKLKEIPGIQKLQCLTSLCIKDCPSLKSIENLRQLQALVELELISCGKLEEIPGLGELRGLTKVNIGYCHSLERIDNLTALKELKEVRLIHCQWLTEIPGLGGLLLDSLHIESCSSLLSLENLQELQLLKKFVLVSYQRLTEISGLGELRGLREVKIEHCHSLKRMDNLTALKELKKVGLVDCPWLTEILGLGGLLHLDSLHIERCSSLLSLENLQELQLLKKFVLVSCQRLTEIPGLGELRGLREVKIEHCHSLKRMDNLTALKELKKVGLVDCPWLTEIPGLGGLLHLDSLHIESCPSLLSLENLQGLQLLNNFVLIDCQKLTEIPGLDKLRCSTMRVIHEGVDSLVIFGRKKESLNSNSGEEVVKEEEEEIGGEVVVVSQLREDVCRNQQSSLTRSSVLVFGLDEYVKSSDGSRSFPISELEGKVVALYFSPSWSLPSIEFTLDLLNIYEKFMAANSETAFEIVRVQINEYYEHSFWKSFGSIPWLSLRPSSFDRCEELCAYFKVSRLSTEPTLVIVGEDGKVLNFNAVDMIKQHGARAYPFTLEKLQQIVNSNEKDNEELVMDANKVWPKKMQHPLHIHQLVPTLRLDYFCDCCNQDGKLWSYYCEECDFDLQCQCASLKNINPTEQSSILEERALQFSKELEQKVNSNANDNEELFKEANMLWPKKLQHHLHIHQLVLTRRWKYICNCCNQEGELWSYCCEECDFDLHCQCASLKNINSTKQSSILQEGDLQFLENPTKRCRR